jgi:hypothetical protein
MRQATYLKRYWYGIIFDTCYASHLSLGNKNHFLDLSDKYSEYRNGLNSLKRNENYGVDMFIKLESVNPSHEFVEFKRNRSYWFAFKGSMGSVIVLKLPRQVNSIKLVQKT